MALMMTEILLFLKMMVDAETHPNISYEDDVIDEYNDDNDDIC